MEGTWGADNRETSISIDAMTSILITRHSFKLYMQFGRPLNYLEKKLLSYWSCHFGLHSSPQCSQRSSPLSGNAMQTKKKLQKGRCFSVRIKHAGIANCIRQNMDGNFLSTSTPVLSCSTPISMPSGKSSSIRILHLVRSALVTMLLLQCILDFLDGMPFLLSKVAIVKIRC